MYNPILESIITLENYREILENLTPKSLALVALRLDGEPSYRAAGELLGMSHSLTSVHMNHARRRLVQKLPHLQREKDTRNPRLGWHYTSATKHGRPCQDAPVEQVGDKGPDPDKG